jgi:hypothetical protein
MKLHYHITYHDKELTKLNALAKLKAKLKQKPAFK